MSAAAHLEETVRVALGIRDGEVDVPRLPENLAARLLRTEEYQQHHRDQWGCWEFSLCESYSRGALWFAELDEWLSARRTELSPRTELEPLWPDGRRFAVCVTHDVDMISDVSTPRQALRSMRASLGAPRSRHPRVVRALAPAVRAVRAARNGIALAPVAETLELSVEIERTRGIRASYFFTVAPRRGASRYDCLYAADDVCRYRGERVRVREILRDLRKDGFDVGLHGSYHSALMPGLLAREKHELEEAVGADVTTTRQHFLHWEITATPRLQQQAGFQADSTLGFNRNVGYRAGTSLPFRHYDVEHDEPLDLIECPLVIHDGALLRSDALELDVPLARETIRRFVDAAERNGSVVTLLFHPNNLEREEYRELYAWSLDYCLDRSAWFASLHDLNAWWRERERKLGRR